MFAINRHHFQPRLTDVVALLFPPAHVPMRLQQLSTLRQVCQSPSIVKIVQARVHLNGLELVPISCHRYLGHWSCLQSRDHRHRMPML
jgi:hypothetical protein